jgi:pimeloyl-ACP methyl ester carboxylesterase
MRKAFIGLTLLIILVSCKPASEGTPQVVYITATPLPSTATTIPTIPPSPVPSPTLVPYFDGEEVDFTTSDDLRINGVIYRGGGDLAVILTHQRDKLATQKSWQPFAELLANMGYTVLTFNFRGIGKSEGDINYMENLLVEDTKAAIEFLQAEGFDRVVCVGASGGGTSCMEASLSHDLLGVIAVAPPLTLGEPTKITDEDLALLTVPKLFICTEDDKYGRIPGEVQLMFDNSPDPKQIKWFTGTVHGTQLFNTGHREEFQQVMIDFLEDLR